MGGVYLLSPIDNPTRNNDEELDTSGPHRRALVHRHSSPGLTPWAFLLRPFRAGDLAVRNAG